MLTDVAWVKALRKFVAALITSDRGREEAITKGVQRGFAMLRYNAMGNYDGNDAYGDEMGQM